MSNLAADVAGCPDGCDTCAIDGNNVKCKSNGCSDGRFYADDGQCVGQFIVGRLISTADWNNSVFYFLVYLKLVDDSYSINCRIGVLIQCPFERRLG